MTRLLPCVLVAACAQQPHWDTNAPEAPCVAGSWPSGPLVLDIDHGRSRRALVWMPPGPGPHDVVIDLHEFRSDPNRQAHYSQWVPLAAEINAILVAPDGRAATWNADGCCGKAAEEMTDDVGFLDKVAAAIEGRGCTTGRVLATGIGNGAMMAHTWACASSVPDGVISVGGALQAKSCAGRPIPVLHYHGSKDAFFPADGSKGSVGFTTQPVADALATWAARNSASPAAPIEDGGLRCQTWEGAAPIVSCQVDGMADSWPGADDAPPKSAHPLARAASGGWSWISPLLASEPRTSPR